MNTTTQHFIQELQANPDILGIILFGSWARGNNRPDSDVDLLVIVRHGSKRTVEYRECQAFEMTYTTEQAAIAYWQSNPNDAIELWSIAKILFDRDETVARLRQTGDQIKASGKSALTSEQYEHYRFDVSDQMKAIETLAMSDSITAKMLLSSKVLQLTELFFDVRQLWTPPPKQRLESIKNRNYDLYKLIRSYYDESSFVEQINIVRLIITIVFDT